MQPETLPQADLRDAVGFQVSTGALNGFIGPLGHMHGLILAGVDSTPITQPFMATMNLEHYCERARGSRFVPRNEVAQAYEVDGDSVTVHFARHPDWAVTSAVRYTRRENGVFDVLFTFDFDEAYTRFEAFVASYFHGRVVPFVASDGKVFRPEIEPPVQLFFPRDEDAREQVSDGRWQFLDDFKLRADTYDDDGKLYDAPITIHRPDDSDYAFVQMMDRRECSAVSVNTFAFAQDFSLMGRDVAAGERVAVRARVVYTELERPEDAVSLWKDWQADIA
jgi:hypothetical protein